MTRLLGVVLAFGLAAGCAARTMDIPGADMDHVDVAQERLRNGGAVIRILPNDRIAFWSVTEPGGPATLRWQDGAPDAYVAARAEALQQDAAQRARIAQGEELVICMDYGDDRVEVFEAGERIASVVSYCPDDGVNAAMTAVLASAGVTEAP